MDDDQNDYDYDDNDDYEDNDDYDDDDDNDDNDDNNDDDNNDYFFYRFIEVGAIHYSHLSAAMTQTGKVMMWGQCRGQSITAPLLTRYVFVFLSALSQ